MSRDKPSMREHFKDVTLELAAENDKLVVVFGDISLYLFRDFRERFPLRFFNAGICENALVSIAAGMSAVGLCPFVHTINPFLSERSFEQIKLDMSYNEFGGNIVTCGATYDYAWDGATHHCYNDIAMLRRLPGVEVMQPGSNAELEILLRDRYDNGKTSYFRISHDGHGKVLPIEFGKGVVVRGEGAALTVITAGPLLANVLAACREFSVNILYFHTIKPFDYCLLAEYRHTKLLVVEEAHGLHDAVAEAGEVLTRRHGLPDKFCGCYGTLEDVRSTFGFDIQGIRAAVKAWL